MAEMWLNMGPQHPMTHGLWNLRVKIDGETITEAEPVIGYLHRGWEKITENQDVPADHPHGRPAVLRRLHELEPLLLPDHREPNGRRGAGAGEVHPHHRPGGAEDREPPDVARGPGHRPGLLYRLPLPHEGEGAVPRPDAETSAGRG